MFANVDCVLRGGKEVIDTEQQCQDFNTVNGIHLVNGILAPYALYLHFHIAQTLNEIVSLFSFPLSIS